jgi:hypothetical protein
MQDLEGQQIAGLKLPVEKWSGSELRAGAADTRRLERLPDRGWCGSRWCHRPDRGAGSAARRRLRSRRIPSIFRPATGNAQLPTRARHPYSQLAGAQHVPARCDRRLQFERQGQPKSSAAPTLFARSTSSRYLGILAHCNKTITHNPQPGLFCCVLDLHRSDRP